MDHRGLRVGIRTAVAAIFLAAATSLIGLPAAQAAGGAFVVEDSEVGEPGACKVESWLLIASTSDLAATAVPACAFRIGLPTELSAQVQRTRIEGEYGSTLTFKTKSTIIPLDENGFGLGMFAGGRLDLITGESSGAFAGIPLTLKLGDQLKVNLNAGWIWDRMADQHSAAWGAGFEWNFVEPLTLIGEVFGEAAGAENRVGSQLGLRYTPAPNVDLDVILGQSFTQDRARWIVVGLNLRFDPPGKNQRK